MTLKSSGAEKYVFQATIIFMNNNDPSPAFMYFTRLASQKP